MRRLKNNISYLISLGILLFIFKGFLYRNLITNQKLAERKIYTITNNALKEHINTQIANEPLTLEKIIDISQEITADRLHFSTEEINSDPNISYNTGKANCVGYAAMFATIGNYILQEKALTETYKINHVVGTLELFGENIHDLFKSPFFKDHDYNEIIDKQTGERLYVDPSLYDYTWINRVTAE